MVGGRSFVNSPSCADNPKNKTILQKIICQGQQNPVDAITFALLTSGTVPAVIAQTAKWIRCGKPSKGAPYAYGALALWGLEVGRSLREIRKQSNNQEPELGAEEPEAESDGYDVYYPDADVKNLIESATNRINSFLKGSLCTNASAHSVFGLCGACSTTAEFCGRCQGITLKLLNNEVKPKLGENNYIFGDTKEFYNNIINANDEELWKIIYTPFSQLWEELKPNSDAVWNYSNNKLTLKAGGTGNNFCQGIPPI